jgi:hypothetical protein
MSTTAEDRGIVILCTQDGTVQRVVRDDLGLSVRVHVGSHINDLVDLGVREKIGRFLVELQTRQAAYDWEITVPVDGKFLPLHFAGARLEAAYLVVAAHSRTALAHFDDELMRINNEQSNWSAESCLSAAALVKSLTSRTPRATKLDRCPLRSSQSANWWIATIGLGHLFIAQTLENFERLAPCRKHPATGPFVLVHGHHELKLGVCVVTLTGCRVNTTAPTAYSRRIHRASGPLGSSAICASGGRIRTRASNRFFDFFV